MGTQIPVTIEGNLTGAPESGTTTEGKAWARLRVAVNDRRLNPDTNKWEDAGTVFHDVSVFGRQAENVASSLQEGDSVLVAGDLRFRIYDNPDTGQVSEVRQIIADTVAASLRYRRLDITRPSAAEAAGPDSATNNL